MDWLSRFVLLFPQGSVALSERDLMLQAFLFMLIVAVPVFGLIFFFAWRYRDRGAAANEKPDAPLYTPDWAHSYLEELIWWAIPLEIVLVLAALTWGSTHALDPRKPLSAEPPLVVEVVALDWKWLFIYPEQNIATLNYLEIPAGRPVEFKVTADAPMNSFWIPSLGGQIYAMTGMVNTLNLEAEAPGRFDGRSANYSGIGFADMQFVTQADATSTFDAWVSSVQQKYPALDSASYAALAKPATSSPASFGSVSPGLFGTIVGKFTSGEPAGGHDH
ncbi:MAG TPA: COX aromatic rich motif-containing protein [Candidatus Paceibacterota bacterium]|nr:COX aromatic rich motif-containing protein [Candidatus Paceibacterota bacterium]